MHLCKIQRSSLFLLSFFLIIHSISVYATESDESIHHDHNTQHMMQPDTDTETEAEAESYSIEIHHIKDNGPQKMVTFSIVRKSDHSPLSLNDLTEVHTKKLHVLINNGSLDDYKHIHPEPTSKSGEFTFSFTPKQNAHYKMWADVTPRSTNEQHFIVSDLMSNNQPAKPTEKVSLQSTVYPYHFTLSFDKPVINQGTPVMGKILVRDIKQRPVKNLEPVMGAYAHIVAFSSDFQSINHVHPMGTEPKSDTERGGPSLEFHFEPARPGFVKLYAQVKINGQDIYVPFGFFVK